MNRRLEATAGLFQSAAVLDRHVDQRHLDVLPFLIAQRRQAISQRMEVGRHVEEAQLTSNNPRLPSSLVSMEAGYGLSASVRLVILS